MPTWPPRHAVRRRAHSIVEGCRASGVTMMSMKGNSGSEDSVALTLICRSSYRGVVEFLRDLLGMPISIGTVHQVLQLATRQAAVVNNDQDLSGIRVGLHDEIFQ